jgi:hypothetical protein
MRLIVIALKTELTREILLSVRFLFSKSIRYWLRRLAFAAAHDWLSGLKFWRQKNRLVLLGGVFNEQCPATYLSLSTSIKFRYRA